MTDSNTEKLTIGEILDSVRRNCITKEVAIRLIEKNKVSALCEQKKQFEEKLREIRRLRSKDREYLKKQIRELVEDWLNKVKHYEISEKLQQMLLDDIERV